MEYFIETYFGDLFPFLIFIWFALVFFLLNEAMAGHISSIKVLGGIICIKNADLE